MISIIKDFLLNGDPEERAEPRLAPDTVVVIKESSPKKKKEIPKNVIKTTWGPRKGVLVIFKHLPGTATFFWQRWNGDLVDAMDGSYALNWADNKIIEAYDLKADNYLAVKPYVINTELTNREIAKALSKSLSWTEKIIPRVKEANALFVNAPSPTEEEE